MTVETMRGWLKARYPGDNKWSRRVATMHDDQVIAIYYRMLRDGEFKKKRRAPKIIHKVQYSCPDCGANYVRDNPCLEECEFCGSKNIEKIV